MNNELKKIKSFTDLDAWKEGHKLVLMVYEITKKFPKEEMFGLVSQMRRCVVSITSNIAEGFSRQTYKDKICFYSRAQGSVTELQN
ncbi:MAG: four helix bundle protein [Patescibacteria group bacterium]|nr:four helix bundle protein [Patescibacteria group bacterium]